MLGDGPSVTSLGMISSDTHRLRGVRNRSGGKTLLIVQNRDREGAAPPWCVRSVA